MSAANSPSARSAGGSGDLGGGTDTPTSAAARLFDIRLIIGGLFLLYGLMLTIAGFFTSASARAKADGININLWLGIGMLLVGAVFVLWLRLRPLRPDADTNAP